MNAQRPVRSLIWTVYAPALLLHLGEGLLIPTLPLYLRDVGMSLTMTSVVVAAAGFGALLSNIPAAMWMERRGVRAAMAVGVVVTAGTSVGLALFRQAVPLIVVQALSGGGMVLWGLSRKVLILQTSAAWARGRAMSTYGAINRAATLGGPAIGGIIATAFGYRAAFIAAGALSSFALIGVGRRSEDARSVDAAPASPWTFVRVFREHTKLLAAMGVGQMLTFAIRRGRYVILPLYAASLGMRADRIGLILSLSALVDLAVSPVSGQIMDRLGRLYAVVPSFVVMGIGVALIPLSHGFIGLLGAAVLIGAGNGVGSGTMLTLSTDVAPSEAPGPFLGALGVVRDGGSIIGPVLVGTIADAMTLGASAVALGLTGIGAAIVFAFGVGETRAATEPAS